MLNIILITVLIYSTITFIISLITNNEEVDRVLAYGFVGMFVWLIFYPVRLYLRNGFYLCKFYQDDEIADNVFVRGGEKSYRKLLQKYPKDKYDCRSEDITYKEYFKCKYLHKSL